MPKQKDLYPTRGAEERVIDRVDPVVYPSTSAPGGYALDEESLCSYEKDGFVVLPGIFSGEELRAFSDWLEAIRRSEELRGREEFITEPDGDEIRTIFSPHRLSPVFDRLSRDPRVLDKVRQILGGDVYIHHSRVNIKRGLAGRSFPWHSDFETWHAEDGLPRMRCLTAWVMLTENSEFNGPLYLVPGSHKRFVSCAGATPEENYRGSLKKQEYGTPSMGAIARLVEDGGIKGVYGPPGTLVLHEGNIMHGSPDNISPMPRTNIFFVYNSVLNAPAERPFGANEFRPPFLSSRDHSPLEGIELERN